MEQNQNIIGQRLIRLRKETRKSQTAFGALFGYSRSHWTRFEHGKAVPDETTLAAVARKCKTSIPYLRGETDIRNWEQYLQSEEYTLDAAMEELAREEKAYRKKVQSLFDLFGYQYDNLSESPAYDFSEKAVGPHCITPYTSTEKTYFSENDLAALLSKIAELIDFECYRQSKKAPS